MNIGQRILKNIASLLFSDIITKLFGFIGVVYLARILGPADFGKINFAGAIVLYFYLITDMGLSLLGIREIARERGKIGDYVGSIITLKLCLVILGFSSLSLITFFLNKPLEIKYLIILYGLGLIPSAFLINWVFQGIEKMEYIGVGSILGSGINLGLILYFIKSHEQLLLVPCIQIASNLLIIGFLFFIFIIISDFGMPKFKIDLTLWKRLLCQAIPIGLSGIMVQIIWHMDTVMLGFMKNNEVVGYYNAAYKIIFLFIMVLSAYFNSIFPVMSNYYKNSTDSLRRLQTYTVKLMVILGLPISFGGTILAEPIMNLLYGAKYKGGVIALQILIWALPLIYINSAYGWGLLACEKQDKYLKIVTIQAIGNLFLNLILIPPFGLVGAAIATIAAEVIGIPLYYIEFSKVVWVPFCNHIFKPLVASFILGLFLYFGINVTNLSVVLLILGGIGIYFLFLYLLGGINREEIRLIQGLIRVNRR